MCDSLRPGHLGPCGLGATSVRHWHPESARDRVRCRMEPWVLPDVSPGLTAVSPHWETEDSSMANPVWTGTVTFGMVSLAVRLFPARERHGPQMHQFARGTSERVRFRE